MPVCLGVLTNSITRYIGWRRRVFAHARSSARDSARTRAYMSSAPSRAPWAAGYSSSVTGSTSIAIMATMCQPSSFAYHGLTSCTCGSTAHVHMRRHSHGMARSRAGAHGHEHSTGAQASQTVWVVLFVCVCVCLCVQSCPRAGHSSNKPQLCTPLPHSLLHLLRAHISQGREELL